MHLRTFSPIPQARTTYDKPFTFMDNGEPFVQITAHTHRAIGVEPVYYLQQIEGSWPDIYVRQTVYEKLLAIADRLPPSRQLILYDGYRPFAVQHALFQLIQAQIAAAEPHLSVEALHEKTLTYVAWPSTQIDASTPHLTGGAVDVTLADETGAPLWMGSAFDETSTLSATAYFEQQGEDAQVRDNRRELYTYMTEAGFSNYEEEWWHYEYGTKAWAARTKQSVTRYTPQQFVPHD